MKICDVCQQTVSQVGGGPKGMENLDACPSCMDDLHRRIQALNQNLLQDREQRWSVMLQEWRKARAPQPPE